MAAANLRSEERIGLVIALAAHVALVAVLVLRPPAPAPFPLPERMTVTLSDDAGLTSTSPEPEAQPAPDVAPVLGEAPPPPAPVIAPEPIVRPLPIPRVAPAPTRALTKQAAKPSVPARQTTAPTTPQRRPAASAGGSRVGSDFLKGVSGARTNGAATNPPAAAIGPQVRSALAGAISRQLKPKWTAPQGVDAEKLVTILAWSLNRDGTLSGSPRVVRQDGINDANRAQAQRHAEQAVRAVQLAAPFTLPPEYYDAWKRVADFRFDRRLSQ